MRWLQLCSSLNILWHCPSLGLEWKLTFSSPVATDEISKFAGILSAALPQHYLSGFEIAQLEFHQLLAFFIVLLSKAHLTSHSRMSSSRWVITPSWLSGSLRSFLYSSSVYSWYLLLSSASVRYIPFLFFIVLIFAWNVPLVSLIFLKRSLVFSILLLSSTSLHWSEEGFLISPCYCLKLHIQMGKSFLSSFAFHFYSFLSYL